MLWWSLTIAFGAASLVGSALYCSVGEWVLHSRVMHRPVGPFRYPYNAHALVHHVLYKADASYHVLPGRVPEKVTMAKWNGCAIVAIGGLPVYLAAAAIGYWSPVHGWILGLTGVTVFSANYGLYEYFHWCMHVPKDRWIERQAFFRRLNGHHLLHHRYHQHNFNMVLPFADWRFGTLLLRAKFNFRQAQCPALPDVQPASA